MRSRACISPISLSLPSLDDDAEEDDAAFDFVLRAVFSSPPSLADFFVSCALAVWFWTCSLLLVLVRYSR